MAVLELRRLTKVFSGLQAVNEFDLSLDDGELVGLIGPNGAGKSTIFNLISGVVPPSSGSVIFHGRNIAGQKSFEISRLGISRTFQITSIFGGLTVLQNAMIGAQVGTGLGMGILDTFIPQHRKRDRLRLKGEEVLEQVGLSDLANERAGNLPHGRQQALGVAIALAAEPRVLLLDEPLGGLTLEETVKMMNLIDSLRRDQKRSVLLVEHNVQAVLNYCDRICVLNFGRKLAEGLPSEIIANKAVLDAYFGVDHRVN